MKRSILLFIVSLLFLSVFAQEYIDLGLPSGTKWKSTDEQGLYTYPSARYFFHDALPNRAQVRELLANCTWKWTGKGYKVTGPNQNCIYFTFNGYLDCDEDLQYEGSAALLWTLDAAGSEWAYLYVLSEEQREILEESNCWSCSVRLVQQ